MAELAYSYCMPTDGDITKINLKWSLQMKYIHDQVLFLNSK